MPVASVSVPISSLSRMFSEAEEALKRRLDREPDQQEVLGYLAQDLVEQGKASGDTGKVATELAKLLGMEYEEGIGMVASGKIPVEQVDIRMAEGPTKQLANASFRGRHAFESANLWLRRQFSGFPYEEGYYKTDYKVTWKDGYEFSGTLHCKPPSEPDNDLDVAEHLFLFAKRYAGPPWNSEPAKEILSTYDLGTWTMKAGAGGKTATAKGKRTLFDLFLHTTAEEVKARIEHKGFNVEGLPEMDMDRDEVSLWVHIVTPMSPAKFAATFDDDLEAMAAYVISESARSPGYNIKVFPGKTDGTVLVEVPVTAPTQEQYEEAVDAGLVAPD